MSELSEAHAELQEACNEVTGKPQYVLIDGKKYSAIIEDVSMDEVFALGGKAESGGFRVMVAKEKFSQEPERFTAIEGRGMELQILGVTNINDTTYEITAGDPSED